MISNKVGEKFFSEIYNGDALAVRKGERKRERHVSIGRMTTVRELLVDNEADKERYKGE